MGSNSDPYWRLRPAPPKSTEEVCCCPDNSPIVLLGRFEPNPLACLSCNLEVPPERIGFTSELAEQIYSWNSFHLAFYTLWLDSGSFEKWAEAQLADPASEVNTRGLEIVSALNDANRCYYWMFSASEINEILAPLETCPRCNQQLARRQLKFERLVCEPCSIVLAWDDR